MNRFLILFVCLNQLFFKFGFCNSGIDESIFEENDVAKVLGTLHARKRSRSVSPAAAASTTTESVSQKKRRIWSPESSYISSASSGEISNSFQTSQDKFEKARNLFDRLEKIADEHPRSDYIIPHLDTTALTQLLQNLEKVKSQWKKRRMFANFTLSLDDQTIVPVRIINLNGNLFCEFKSSRLGEGSTKLYRLMIDCENWIPGATPVVNFPNISKKCAERRVEPNVQSCINNGVEDAKVRIKKDLDIAGSIIGFSFGETVGFPKILHQDNKLTIFKLYLGSLGDFFRVDDQSLDDPVQTFLPVFHALDSMHKKGWIHFDIKPDNILVEKKENGDLISLHLADFDLAKSTQELSTVGTSYRGTLGYVAPEILALKESPGVNSKNQKLTREQADKVDTYSLGVTFLQSLYLSSNRFDEFPILNGYKKCKSQYSGNQNSVKQLGQCYVDYIKILVDRMTSSEEYSALNQLLISMLHSDPNIRLSSDKLEKALMHVFETENKAGSFNVFDTNLISELQNYGIVTHDVKDTLLRHPNEAFSIQERSVSGHDGQKYLELSYAVLSERSGRPILVNQVLDVPNNVNDVLAELRFLDLVGAIQFKQ